ncbi:MAG: hypothetical protein H0V82_08980 [Candidatus Protochlamydia sp.]|nr:hypothetical protein [Candidatus Protochlamydia sp.]
MKEIALSLFKGLTTCILLLGVSMGEAAEKPWVPIKDSKYHMEAAFPHAPIEMSFDIPFENTPAQGRLHVYSCATKTGVYLLCALSIPNIDKKTLEKDTFKKTFEAHLVPRLFYYPQLFKKQQTYSASKKEEGLAFQFSYQDKADKRLLKGHAAVKGSILYTLIYIASEGHFDKHEWEKFQGSFSGF